jgi:hypothetical protein
MTGQNQPRLKPWRMRGRAPDERPYLLFQKARNSLLFEGTI